MPLPRFRLRTLMIAVAVVGAALGLVAHVRAILREDYFAPLILVLKAVAVAVVFVGVLLIGFLVLLVRLLRRNVPRTKIRRDSARYPWLPVPPDPPMPE